MVRRHFPHKKSIVRKLTGDQIFPFWGASDVKHWWLIVVTWNNSFSDGKESYCLWFEFSWCACDVTLMVWKLKRYCNWEHIYSSVLSKSFMMTSSNGTFSALLALCAGNSPVPGEIPAQRPVTRSFDVFFDVRPNKRLSKQWLSWWFETPSRPFWRIVMLLWAVPYSWLVMCKSDFRMHDTHADVNKDSYRHLWELWAH